MKVNYIPAPVVVQPEGTVRMELSETEAGIVKALLDRCTNKGVATHDMWAALTELPLPEFKVVPPVYLVVYKKD